MKIKTSELTGAALDWAVSKCGGGGNFPASFKTAHQNGRANYSTNWAQGGPIIEREGISVGDQTHVEGQPEHSAWYATNRKGAYGFGTTPLIAAMRCYVASKLGDEVDVPEELT